MKQEKWDNIVDEVTEVLADLQYKSFHRVFVDDLIKMLPHIKEKHVRKAWKLMK